MRRTSPSLSGPKMKYLEAVIFLLLRWAIAAAFSALLCKGASVSLLLRIPSAISCARARVPGRGGACAWLEEHGGGGGVHRPRPLGVLEGSLSFLKKKGNV